MSNWDYSEFVAYWRRASSCAQVAKHFKISARVASSTANRLRSRGIKLKLMPPGRKPKNWSGVTRKGRGNEEG